MASYFSNHSASRFLANSAQTASATTAAQTTAPANQQTPAATAPRPRIPSKHFSTTVATGTPTDAAAASTPTSATTIQVHPLRNTWIFWFRQQRSPGNKIISYEEGIKKIAAFSSVESFWSLWTHLTPPSSLQPTTDYLLFHSGIRRPVWEDPLNLSGGKWIIRLRKGVADRLWEDLVLAIIGDQFDDCRNTADGKPGLGGTTKPEDGTDNGTEWPEICGCTISVRQSEDIITLWNRVDGSLKIREQIRDTLRKVLNLPTSVIMEYKSNNGDFVLAKLLFDTTSVLIPTSVEKPRLLLRDRLKVFENVPGLKNPSALRSLKTDVFLFGLVALQVIMRDEVIENVIEDGCGPIVEYLEGCQAEDSKQRPLFRDVVKNIERIMQENAQVLDAPPPLTGLMIFSDISHVL
ncbi:hypothetical protein NLJ89_g309 [Agrocybe chaxingu]|uniref:Eukaryotic translation initiation factor 4E n=1 Tax=Agrocybe chaxingu TaxID=84603 RepID=A0A9W8N272_9AGAR|nr:hypothetical protein NLJ89_g309 [Agrocybe chaxingu]